MKDGQSEAEEVNERGTCVRRKPVKKREMNVFLSFQFSHLEEVHASIVWVFGEFYFQFVVKFWYFDVSRYGLVCWKVTGCLFSDWWDGHEKVRGEKPSLRRAVA